MLRQQVRGIVGYGVLFAALLFGGAGGVLHWPAAWILLATVIVVQVWGNTRIYRANPELVRERAKGPVQHGQPMTDRILVLAFMASQAGLVAFSAADAVRWHLLASIPNALRVIGLVAFAAGWIMVYRALEANAFATFVVRHQQERGHTLVDQGLYRIVRHPMYAGLVPVLVGVPLWLDSLAGVCASCVPISVLAARVVLEERFLRTHLEGYKDYVSRVRFRLVPGVW